VLFAVFFWSFLWGIAGAAATVIFLVQNREIVSVDFLGFSMRTPLALMAAVFYLLGAITGSSAFVLLRRSLQGTGWNAVPR
jgi:uncharacterized integral membrane protein